MKLHVLMHWTAHLIDLCPESVFQPLLGFPHLFVVLESIKVSQHAHYFRKPMNLTNIEELKCLHLKTKTGIHQQQYLNTDKETVDNTQR